MTDSGPFYVEASTAPPKPPYGSPERAIADAIDRAENPTRWVTPDGKPIDRMHQALTWIGTDCESFTRGRCWDNGRVPHARYLANRWCDGCIAAWGLGEEANQR